MKKNNPSSRKENIVVQELAGEVMIYDLNINKAYCLNETSQLVWQLCDGSNSVPQIREKFSKKMNAKVSEDFIWLALDQFKQNGLLAKGTEIEIKFNGSNRREVIRKLGFATLVALPVIASIVAPSAIHAASACSCINPGDCLAQNTCPSTVNCNPSGVCAP